MAIHPVRRGPVLFHVAEVRRLKVVINMSGNNTVIHETTTTTTTTERCCSRQDRQDKKAKAQREGSALSTPYFRRLIESG